MQPKPWIVENIYPLKGHRLVSEPQMAPLWPPGVAAGSTWLVATGLPSRDTLVAELCTAVLQSLL